ncbi:hypothetical protein MSP8886_01181 [Marinomonas spartinae]|uniref:Lipoprotein n=2 Tax=Marinomonas spartinae TaxID=1792290 RepID=A0A1A8T9X6_9GAMM|nr:hypothetical protein MSP8886_01181 [Marinomonas spartinae]
MIGQRCFVRLLLTVFLLLSSCVTMAIEKSDESYSDLSTYSVELSKKLHVIPYSILHISNKVSAAVVTPSGLVQVSVSCNDDKTYWNYRITPKRVYPYPGGYDKYSLPKRLNDYSSQVLHSSPYISNACKSKSDWRVIRYGDKKNNTPGILMDINSLHTTRSGDIFLWSASNEPVVAYDLPFQAPYGYKFEGDLIDCSSKKIAQLVGYDVDDQFRVTDGLVMNRIDYEAISSDPSDYRNVIARAICRSKDQLRDKPLFSPVKKPIVDTKTLTAIPQEVLREITSQKLKEPIKQISQYRMTGTSTFEDKSSSFNDTSELSSTTTNGIWKIKTRTNNSSYKNIQLSFLGLINLSSTTNYGDGNSDSTVLSNLVLKGDWKDMIVGSHISYQVTRNMATSVAGLDYGKPEVTACVVEKKVPAATLYFSLSGNAKMITCHDSQDKNRQIRTSFFLEDYGFFINKDEDDTIKNVIDSSH